MQAVIIVAGGKGTRFGANVPKQYLVLGNAPIYIQTIRQFITFNQAMQIILVLPQSATDKDMSTIATQIKEYEIQDVAICRGGNTRFDSVKNGLKKLNKNIAVVGVHDAVRPLVSQTVIQNCFKTAQVEGSAIPVLPLKDSIRKLIQTGSHAVDRSQYRLVQTPQCFSKEILVNAYEQDNKNFTDDASVVESAGYKIKMVEGNQENIKITTPPDLLFAEFIIENSTL